MFAIMNDDPVPQFQVIKNAATAAEYEVEGTNRWIDLVGTCEGPTPTVSGIWKNDDFVSDTDPEHFEAEYDEMKYILSGSSVWKDIPSGKEYKVEAGDMLFMPRGSKTALLSSCNLSAVYMEQTARATATLLAEIQPLRRSLSEWVVDLKKTYAERNPSSAQAFERASKALPGGNTRSVLYHHPFPMTLSHGHDCHVTSVDGREYLDLVSEYTAALFGHSNVQLQQAVLEALGKGFNLGGNNEYEVQLAESLQRRFESIDLVRFCNSGTEANLMAIALAKAYTGRSKVLIFSHGYHGGVLSFEYLHNSTNVPHDFVMGEFNDEQAAKGLLDDTFAAVVVEPMQSAGGMVPATRAFLQSLRAEADKKGAVLIFDEVVTARLHINGLQGHHQIYPDLTTLGKSIGGGFSVGAFGGRRHIMERLDPRRAKVQGGMSHSGTFNNNLFTMVAGVAAAKILTQEKITRLNMMGDELRQGFQQALDSCNIHEIKLTGFGSLTGLHFSGPRATDLQSAFYLFMLDQGIYVGNRGFMALTFAHERKHIDRVLQSLRAFATAVQALGPEA